MVFVFLIPSLSISRQLVNKPPPPKQKSKRKRAGPDILTGIPLDEDEVVHEVIITWHKKRIQTISKPVHIPLPVTPEHVKVIPGTTEHDDDVYSDVEGVEPLPAIHNRERKGPSHSVSVRSLVHDVYIPISFTNNTLDSD